MTVIVVVMGSEGEIDKCSGGEVLWGEQCIEIYRVFSSPGRYLASIE